MSYRVSRQNAAPSRTLRVALYAVISWSAALVHAQSSLLPAPCVGKTGAELDACVRDIAPPLKPQLEPTPLVQNPAQTVDCNKVHRADQGFCLQRNEVIVECRNSSKHPDFRECFDKYIARAVKPDQLNCEKEKGTTRTACLTRNTRAIACINDPLRYFYCIVGDDARAAVLPPR